MQLTGNMVFAILASVALAHVASEPEFVGESCSHVRPEQPHSPMLFQQSGFVHKDNAKPPESPLVVPLQALEERSFEGHVAPVGRTFHVGNITVGYPPQTLQVMFDTSSPYVLLAHRGCRSKTCKEHHRYSTWQSQTAMDIDLDGQRLDKRNRIVFGDVTRDSGSFDFESADLGAGKATGVLVRDNVCFRALSGVKACAKPGIVIALEMDDVPFRAMPGDGIVGLGLQVACGKGSGVCSFFDNLLQRNPELQPQFGLTFGPTGGELHIGGHHPAALNGPLHWFPVHSPEEGLWQVEIHAVRVGNRVLNSCDHGCHAIIDTSSNRLGVSASKLQGMRTALAAESESLQSGLCYGADLVFDLGGMTIVLGPEDYMDTACKPDLGPLRLGGSDTGAETRGDEDTSKVITLGPPVSSEYSEVITLGSAGSTEYAFGQMVLRHYFVAFDWKAQTVGFAPSASASREMGKPTVPARVEQVTV